MNIISTIFTNFAVAIISTLACYTFLERADGDFAFSDFQKVVP